VPFLFSGIVAPLLEFSHHGALSSHFWLWCPIPGHHHLLLFTLLLGSSNGELWSFLAQQWYLGALRTWRWSQSAPLSYQFVLKILKTDVDRCESIGLDKG
jgi:hypothetical protein